MRSARSYQLQLNNGIGGSVAACTSIGGSAASNTASSPLYKKSRQAVRARSNHRFRIYFTPFQIVNIWIFRGYTFLADAVSEYCSLVGPADIILFCQALLEVIRSTKFVPHERLQEVAAKAEQKFERRGNADWKDFFSDQENDYHFRVWIQQFKVNAHDTKPLKEFVESATLARRALIEQQQMSLKKVYISLCRMTLA